MKRVFYGTCKSGKNESEKRVYVPDLDVIDENFDFEEGDLLAVFFAEENQVDTPSIVVYSQDTEQEVSTTNDSGKFIKSLDVEAGMTGAWAAGETVIFVYTQQETSSTYYWELVDAAHATFDLYGNTKLFDDSDFINWIAEDEDEKDSTIALTPNTLKKFWNLLNGKSSQPDPTPEPSPEPSPEPTPVIEPPLGLKWTPSEEISQYEVQPLGILSLTNNTDGVEITYPINSIIQKYIYEVESNIVTHTGQLFNNGNGKEGEGGQTDETADPFITKMVPDNLYFNNGNGLYYQNGEIAVPRFILNDENNRIVIGNKTDDTLSGIYIAKPVDIDGNTIIRGTLNTKGAITAEGGNTISTAGNVVGGVVYEGDLPLKKKYSGLLAIGTVVSSPYTIGAGKTVQHQLLSTQTPAGYEPLGILGYNINYAGSNAADGRFANLWECCLSGPYVYFALSNVKSSGSITVSCNFVVLYRKVI